MTIFSTRSEWEAAQGGGEVTTFSILPSADEVYTFGTGTIVGVGDFADLLVYNDSYVTNIQEFDAAPGPAHLLVEFDFDASPGNVRFHSTSGAIANAVTLLLPDPAIGDFDIVMAFDSTAVGDSMQAVGIGGIVVTGADIDDRLVGAFFGADTTLQARTVLRRTVKNTFNSGGNIGERPLWATKQYQRFTRVGGAIQAYRKDLVGDAWTSQGGPKNWDTLGQDAYIGIIIGSDNVGPASIGNVRIYEFSGTYTKAAVLPVP